MWLPLDVKKACVDALSILELGKAKQKHLFVKFGAWEGNEKALVC